MSAHHEHAVKGTDGMPESSKVAVEAAHKGYAEATSKAKPEPPVDFAALFHVASDVKLAWPYSVQAWGDKCAANQHVLDSIRRHAHGNPAGAGAPLVQTLISEVLKAVKG